MSHSNDSELPGLEGSLLKAWDKAGRRQRSQMLSAMIKTLDVQTMDMEAARPAFEDVVSLDTAMEDDTSSPRGRAAQGRRQLVNGSRKMPDMSISRLPTKTSGGASNSPRGEKRFEEIALASCTALWASLRSGGALACLLLSRLLGHARVCILTQSPVHLHFQLMAVLVRGAGHGPVLEGAVEGGAAALALDTLRGGGGGGTEHHQDSPEISKQELEWTASFDLLKSIGDVGGRPYKEFLCRRGAAGAAAAALGRARGPQAHRAGAGLLTALGHGNDPAAAAAAREGLLALLGTVDNPLAQSTAAQVSSMLLSPDSAYYSPPTAGAGSQEYLAFVPVAAAALHLARDRAARAALADLCLLLARAGGPAAADALVGAAARLVRRGVLACLAGKQRADPRAASAYLPETIKPTTPEFVRRSVARRALQHPGGRDSASNEQDADPEDNPEVIICHLLTQLARGTDTAGIDISHQSGGGSGGDPAAAAAAAGALAVAAARHGLARLLAAALLMPFDLDPLAQEHTLNAAAAAAAAAFEAGGGGGSGGPAVWRSGEGNWRAARRSVLGRVDGALERCFAFQAAAARAIRVLYNSLKHLDNHQPQPPSSKPMMSFQSFFDLALVDQPLLLHTLLCNTDAFLEALAGDVAAAGKLQRGAAAAEAQQQKRVTGIGRALPLTDASIESLTGSYQIPNTSQPPLGADSLTFLTGFDEDLRGETEDLVMIGGNTADFMGNLPQERKKAARRPLTHHNSSPRRHPHHLVTEKEEEPASPTANETAWEFRNIVDSIIDQSGRAFDDQRQEGEHSTRLEGGRGNRGGGRFIDFRADGNRTLPATAPARAPPRPVAAGNRRDHSSALRRGGRRLLRRQVSAGRPPGSAAPTDGDAAAHWGSTTGPTKNYIEHHRSRRALVHTADAAAARQQLPPPSPILRPDKEIGSNSEDDRARILRSVSCDDEVPLSEMHGSSKHMKGNNRDPGSSWMMPKPSYQSSVGWKGTAPAFLPSLSGKKVDPFQMQLADTFPIPSTFVV